MATLYLFLSLVILWIFFLHYSEISEYVCYKRNFLCFDFSGCVPLERTLADFMVGLLCIQCLLRLVRVSQLNVGVPPHD